MRKLFCSLLLVTAITGAAFAAEEKTPDAADSTPPVVTDNPHIKEMNDKAKALAESLSDEESTYFGGIRDNFGVLRSIEVAQKSVANAVKLCTEKNPDLKDEMTGRHKTWDSEITAAIAKQQDHMKTAVTKDHFKDPAKVKDYLDTIDKAAHYADDALDKRVVTTPEACKNLMNSMDDTQKTILDLVNGMKWPDDAKGAAN